MANSLKTLILDKYNDTFIFLINDSFPNPFSSYSLIINLFIILIFFFTSLLLLSSNPLHGSFFLVLIFICTSYILLLLNIGFFAYVFIIIYAGAIAVLFLFIVMMLNLRKTDIFNTILSKGIEKQQKIIDYQYYIYVCLFVCYTYIGLKVIIYLIVLNQKVCITPKDFLNLHMSQAKLVKTNYLNDDILNQLFLYDEFSYIILISGLILFIAIIGAIIIVEEVRDQRFNNKIKYTQITKHNANRISLYSKCVKNNKNDFS